MDFFQELKDLTGALEAGAVDYALCGGVALAIHGVPRATQDIDLLVRPEDLARLREIARTCGFVLESFPMDFASGITIQRFTKLIDGHPLMLDALLVGGSLDGAWKFHWVKQPDERPQGFFQPTFDVSGWKEISVPSS